MSPGPVRHDASVTPRPESDRLPGPGLLGLVVLVQAALRVLYILHHRADSDEPQHLHVVWGWTQGLVQYRDFFDNHAPLFHLLMVPWVRGWGERPDLLVLVRWLMLPLVALSFAAVRAIGRDLWSSRLGWWGAALGGLVPSF